MKRPIVRLGTVGIVCALWLGSSFHRRELQGAEGAEVAVGAEDAARAGAAGTGTESATGPWRAGLARAIMTPEKPIWLAGYGHRTHPAEGKIHDLWIKVFALEAPDGKRAVFVAGDHLGYPREMYERLSKELASRFLLERAQVILACSHTHSGPVLGRALLPCYPLDAVQLGLIDEYTAGLERKIIATVGEALAGLAPAELSMGGDRADFAVNRRQNREAEVPKLRADGTPLAGPVDHDVPVLAVRSPKGELRAIVFGYACHNTNLDTYLWCGDYAGFAQAALEARHPGASALFWIGCGADQNPLPRRSLALCEDYGRRLAQAVERALEAPLRPVAPRLRTAYASVDLDFDSVPARADLEATTKSENAIQARWAKGLLATLDEGKTFARSYPLPVQAWALGGELWIAMGGEVVVDYALRFKAEYGPGTWVIGYANDVMGYIPSARVWKEGGYESGALHEYGMPANRWAGDLEDRIAREVEKLVRAVK